MKCKNKDCCADCICWVKESDEGGYGSGRCRISPGLHTMGKVWCRDFVKKRSVKDER